ncbi:oleate delta-12 desaturase [Melanomma pulvis-pyrius CBS 109.77]|uniref:Oleate delta-12 desaturase n=1 Tax=Melanomma pulvis-pyrius CBS 109.77 TaxID=1314802 RepID=A0A6A6XC07_9PLEO|nr:oleate delta-12 desaturase [Melanomma pulvis-pyrius CBS 109.77]
MAASNTSTTKEPSDASPSSSTLTQRSKCSPKPTTSTLIDTNGNPFTLPTYTIQEIRSAIPLECFERNPLTASLYIFRDLFQIAVVFYMAHSFITPEYVALPLLRGILWSIYGFVNGLFGTGVWILAHECGHQAFSPSKVLNDTVGFVLHSLLLVPYFSWKISHGKHHKGTAHMERDTVHLPPTRETFAAKRKMAIGELAEAAEDAPLYSMLYILARQMAGWLVYLWTNNTGHDCHEKQAEGRGVGKKNGLFGGVNHFNPNSPLFEAKDAKLVWASDVGVLAALGGLAWVGMTFGWANLGLWYVLPYFWVNHWLVAITYLQHNDASLPHYDSESWTFLRGAAASIDRDMGFLGRYVFHDIAETHVLHHYVSTIPHYHAERASKAIRPVMGEHYRSDTEGGMWGFMKAMWTVIRVCQWVEPSEGAEGVDKHILFFRNNNGLGIKPMSMKGSSI